MNKKELILQLKAQKNGSRNANNRQGFGSMKGIAVRLAEQLDEQEISLKQAWSKIAKNYPYRLTETINNFDTFMGAKERYYDLLIENGQVTIGAIGSFKKEPEKVEVPKEFDEWYKEIKEKFDGEEGKQFALYKICQFGFGHLLEDVNDNAIASETVLGTWIDAHKQLAVDAINNGYTVKDPHYVVKVSNMYFVDFGEDGCHPTFVIDDSPDAKCQARQFNTMDSADRVISEFGGKVEEV